MNNQIRKLTCNIELLNLVILLMQAILLTQALPQEISSIEPMAKNKPLLPSPEDAKNCGDNFTKCQNLSYYPSDIVSQFFTEGKISKLDLEKTDIIGEEDKPRFADEDMFYNYLCYFRDEIIHPRVAQKPDGDYTYVVQAPELDFNQGLRVEICMNTGQGIDTGCQNMQYLPMKYQKARCVQKYVHKKLLTFNTTSGITNEPIAVPSCCVCEY